MQELSIRAVLIGAVIDTSELIRAPRVENKSAGIVEGMPCRIYNKNRV